MAQIDIRVLFDEPFVRAYIDAVNDFRTIIDLYNLSPVAMKMLGCDIVTHSTNDYFVDEASVCDLTPYKRDLLSKLNIRFQLRVEPPLSFSKLVRAYYRSGINPTCDSYASILDCMHNAASNGNIDQLFALHDKWLGYHRQMDEYMISYGIKLPDYTPGSRDKWYNSNIYDLITLAYKHGHLIEANRLWDLVNVNDSEPRDHHLFEAIFRMVKGWMKVILRPYKIRRSRDIRAENYAILYNPKVSDADKGAIWATQYNIDKGALPSASVYAADMPADAVKLIDLATHAKFGILLYDIGAYNLDICDRIRVIYSAYSGDKDLIEERSIDWYGGYSYDSVVMFRRGYYQGLQHREGLAFDWNATMIFSVEYVYMSEFLTTFTLDELVASAMGEFGKFGQPQGFREKSTLTTIVEGHLGHLYEAYVSKFGAPDVNLIGASLEYAISNIRDIPMLNKLLDIAIKGIDLSKSVDDDHRHRGARWGIGRWIARNYELWRDIWMAYGRKQFEDSLMYLSPLLRVTDGSPENLLSALRIAALYSPGLMAYINRYKLLADGQLQPITDGSIFLRNSDNLEIIIDHGVRFGDFDMVMLRLRM